jgi:hypothetical protein
MGKIAEFFSKHKLINENRLSWGPFIVDPPTGKILSAGPLPMGIPEAWEELKKHTDANPSATVVYREPDGKWVTCGPDIQTTTLVSFDIDDGRTAGLIQGKNNQEVHECVDKRGNPIIVNQKVNTPDGKGTVIKNIGRVSIVQVDSLGTEKEYSDQDLEIIEESRPKVKYVVSIGYDGKDKSTHGFMAGAKKVAKLGHYIHKYKDDKYQSSYDHEGNELPWHLTSRSKE